MALQILLLMVVLNLVFYTPVAKVLDERDEYIRKNLTEASETLAKAEAITKQYEQDLAQERRESQLIIASAQKEAQEIVAMEINQAQKDTEALVNEATQQLNTQKEKALLHSCNHLLTLDCRKHYAFRFVAPIGEEYIEAFFSN